MEENKTRAMKAMVEDYQAIFSLLGFIPSDEARVRACNGLFIEWNRRPIPAKPPERITAVRKGSVVDPTPPTAPLPPSGTASIIVTFPEEGGEPEVEVVPTPAKPPEPKPTSPIAGTLDKPPAPAVPPKVQTFDVTPEDAAKSSLPAYDRINLFWNYCPNHPGEPIDYKSQRTDKPYQACLKCGNFLGADGKKTPMRR